jgi:hypothetical protein
MMGFLGPFLSLFAFLPGWWFFFLSFYSSLVVLRCTATLSRPYFAKRLRKDGWEVPMWYDEINNPPLPAKPHKKKNKGNYRVRTVLAGWIITHTTLAISSTIMGAAFFLLFFNSDELAIYAAFSIMYTAVLILFFGLSQLCYRAAVKSNSLRNLFNIIDDP